MCSFSNIGTLRMCLLAHWELPSTYCPDIMHIYIYYVLFISMLRLCCNTLSMHILNVKVHSQTATFQKISPLRRCRLAYWEYIFIHWCISTLTIFDFFQLAQWECAWTPCQSTFSIPKDFFIVLIFENKHVENKPTSTLRICFYTLLWYHRCSILFC